MSRMPSSVAEVARRVNGEPLARQQPRPAVVEDVLISRCVVGGDSSAPPGAAVDLFGRSPSSHESARSPAR